MLVTSLGQQELLFSQHVYVIRRFQVLVSDPALQILYRRFPIRCIFDSQFTLDLQPLPKPPPNVDNYFQELNTMRISVSSFLIEPLTQIHNRVCFSPDAVTPLCSTLTQIFCMIPLFSHHVLNILLIWCLVPRFSIDVIQ